MLNNIPENTVPVPPDAIQPGDLVQIGGLWGEVARVDDTTVYGHSRGVRLLWSVTRSLANAVRPTPPAPVLTRAEAIEQAAREVLSVTVLTSWQKPCHHRLRAALDREPDDPESTPAPQAPEPTEEDGPAFFCGCETCDFERERLHAESKPVPGPEVVFVMDGNGDEEQT